MQEIWVIGNRGIYVDWSFCCCCYCYCCCHCVMLLLFICHYRWTTATKLHSNNNNNDNKKINPDMSYWKLSNFCTFIFLLLLLCNCVVARTTKWHMKHILLCNCVVATTTKLYIKHNRNKNKKINLHTFCVQL